MTTRRKFLSNGLQAAAIVPVLGACTPSVTSQGTSVTKEQPNEPSQTLGTDKLRILILGGTSFLGPHQIKYAIDRGHSVSIFTRGQTVPTVNTEYFDKVERLIGDREDNLDALKDREWDAVIDNSGRKVKWTEDTAKLLKGKVKHYSYVSSVSVFYPYYKEGSVEEDPVVLEMPANFEDGEKGLYDYGIMKANSELVARRIFGDENTAVVRPTFMTGPADRTDRFMFWPTQLAKGGDIILPGKSDEVVQWIDVRDIAEWMIRLAEDHVGGTFNGVGPATKMSAHAYIYGAHAAFGTPVNWIKIDDPDFLEANNLTWITPWIRGRDKFQGIMKVNNQAALENGLTFRPLAETIKDTHDWWYSDAVDVERRSKYEDNPDALHNRQAKVIKKWQARG